MRAHIRKILLFGVLITAIIYAVYALQSDTVPNTQYSAPQPWIETEKAVIHEKQEPATFIPTKPDLLVKPEVETIQKPTVPTILVSLSVNDYSAQTSIPVGSSVYELMNGLKNKGLVFTAKYFGSGMGYFITEINGIQNDEKGGTYWTLYVNGKESPLGASSYILKEADSVTWKFENRLNPVR